MGPASIHFDIVLPFSALNPIRDAAPPRCSLKQLHFLGHQQLELCSESH
jgi:hypothetical protein